MDLDRLGESVLERLRAADTAAYAKLAFDAARLRDMIRTASQPKVLPDVWRGWLAIGNFALSCCSDNKKARVARAFSCC